MVNEQLLLFSIRSEVISLIYLEYERLSCMQRWLLQIEYVEAIVVMESSAQDQTALSKESVGLYIL